MEAVSGICSRRHTEFRFCVSCSFVQKKSKNNDIEDKSEGVLWGRIFAVVGVMVAHRSKSNVKILVEEIGESGSVSHNCQ